MEIAWSFPTGVVRDTYQNLLAAADGSREHKISIAWDKTGIFPWRWLNGGYRARDSVGELFRVQIRDFWFHFQNELAYLYFLDLNGDGHIDKETGLILGATIMGAHAVEMIHEVGVAIADGLSVTELGEIIHAHPTVSEMVMDAAQQAIGVAPYLS